MLLGVQPASTRRLAEDTLRFLTAVDVSRVVEIDTQLEGRRYTCRLDLLPSEIAKLGKAIEEEKAPANRAIRNSKLRHSRRYCPRAITMIPLQKHAKS
jgi:hypothetical protein